MKFKILYRFLKTKRKLLPFLNPILKAYSGIFFIPNPLAGLAIFLLTLYDINIGLSGLLAVLSAYLFARFLGFSKTFLSLDYYIHNPLLVGLGIGFLFKLSLLTAVLIAVASVLTFLLTYAMASVFGYYLGLPILSIPFVVVSVIVYLASYASSNLFVYYLYPHGEQLFQYLPLWVKGFFKSLGEVIFYPNPLVGLVLFLLLLRFSPILAFLSAVGYYIGTSFYGFITGDFYRAYSDGSSFNYILAATALGGVFLIPHLRSYLIALLGVLVSVPVVLAAEIFFQNYGLPVFALPFNFVVLLTVYALASLGFKYRTLYYWGTPEETLDRYLAYQNRFPSGGREVGLPFSGMWTVWQSFDGEWTHKGPWRYALDFVITDEEGKTYRGSGLNLTDYYAYKKPVLSPVSGTVVEVVDGFPDNPPGEADKQNNWGNYVLIYDWRGFYVLLCHFSPNTIKVKKGNRVERGTLLGLCGNSGYSPQPHIHMHVQLSPVVGSPTVPFAIDTYITATGKLFDHSVPKKGEKIEAFYPDKVLQQKFNLLIAERYDFEFLKGEQKQKVTLKVNMAPDGTFYLTDGVGFLYFGQKYGIFYSYNLYGDSEVLKVLFTALSKVPLNFNRPLEWKDTLPLSGLVKIPFLKWFLFLGSFQHELLKVLNTFHVKDKYTYTFKGKFLNKTFEGYVKVSASGKFIDKLSLKVGDKNYFLKKV
jgi:urea transporter/murein DD-endopeptidase MepM/ murein hydrolase activator NlpD